MGKYFVGISIVLVSLVFGQTSLYIYENDQITPFDYRNIMVGTELNFIVCSDSNDYWSGGLFVDGNDRAFGTLSAMDYDPNSRDYAGSHLEDAGSFAKVTSWRGSSKWGFDLFNFYPIVDGNSECNDVNSGEWFIINYKAEEIGDCNIGFYEYTDSWDDPNYYTTLTQVETRDFDDNNQVDFGDYAILASNWRRNDCQGPGWCGGTDLNLDGDVDILDLVGFVDFWLWPEIRTEYEPQILPVDPNIILRIVDINDNNEITIDVNESITLYLRLETTEQGHLGIFDVEVQISDVNLGDIDNRPYSASDPNDPNNGTARILAEPRYDTFDCIGPGYEQYEGISLSAANIGADINDGNLASFVFTCKGQGDVTLDIENYSTIHPKLEGILIHQYDPNLQQMMSSGGVDYSTTSQVSSAEFEPMDVNELVLWLETIYEEDPTISQDFNETDWNNFIEDVKSCNE